MAAIGGISLDALVSEPERALRLSAFERRQILLKCASIQTAIAAMPEEPTASQERLIEKEEAAKLLGISPRTLERRSDYPFVVKDGGCVRYDFVGIQEWIRHRREDGR